MKSGSTCVPKGPELDAWISLVEGWIIGGLGVPLAVRDSRVWSSSSGPEWQGASAIGPNQTLAGKPLALSPGA